MEIDGLAIAAAYGPPIVAPHPQSAPHSQSAPQVAPRKPFLRRHSSGGGLDGGGGHFPHGGKTGGHFAHGGSTTPGGGGSSEAATAAGDLALAVAELRRENAELREAYHVLAQQVQAIQEAVWPAPPSLPMIEVGAPHTPGPLPSLGAPPLAVSPPWRRGVGGTGGHLGNGDQSTVKTPPPPVSARSRARSEERGGDSEKVGGVRERGGGVRQQRGGAGEREGGVVEKEGGDLDEGGGATLHGPALAMRAHPHVSRAIGSHGVEVATTSKTASSPSSPPSQSRQLGVLGGPLPPSEEPQGAPVSSTPLGGSPVSGGRVSGSPDAPAAPRLGRGVLLRSMTLPSTPGSHSRKALIEKLERGGSAAAAAGLCGRGKLERSNSTGGGGGGVGVKGILLEWCKSRTRGYTGVDIQNFTGSWGDGLAFCALVHSFHPDAFDFESLSAANPRHNFHTAFSAAERLCDCDRLIEVDDMVAMRHKPDPKCIFTYVQALYQHLRR